MAGPTLARAQEGELPAVTAGLARVRAWDAVPSCLRPTWASLIGSLVPGRGRHPDSAGSTSGCPS